MYRHPEQPGSDVPRNEKAGNSRMNRIVLATALGAALWGAPAAAAQEAPVPAEPPPLTIETEAQALAQLEQAQASLSGTDPTAADPTLELRDLLAALPHLEGSDRREARALLARPPVGGAEEPFGGEWTGPEADDSPVCDGQFCVHWTESGADRPDLDDGPPTNGVPDYVDLVLQRMEESYDVQNTTLGWPEPKSDGAAGQGPSGESSAGMTDVYLSEICAAACVFGYAAPDDDSAECDGPPFRCAAFLVLDNDYEEFGYPDPDIPLSVTAAHEYNHILQFAIDALQDVWMFESTATWAEEQVFPDANDWLLSYMAAWARNPNQSLTKASAGGGLRVYGSAVWNHWLELGAGYGADVILDSWERSRDSNPKDFAVGAYDLGIRDNGGAGFAREFMKFTAATAEWRVNNDDFPDEEALPDVARKGKVRPGGRAARFRLDHTAYRLIRVKPGDAGRVRLRVRAPRGVRTGIALVARDGPALGGAITEKLDYLSRGGQASVSLDGVQAYERVTAVIANADGRVSGFGSTDWRYRHDDEQYRVSLKRG
jgi:hypothetical protein